jgi:hypothetical protein
LVKRWSLEMDWKLLRLDDAFEPPLLTFSLHDTRDAALQVARDKPREGEIRNRIEGPNGLVINHDEILRWCREHPAPAKPDGGEAVRPNLHIAFRTASEEVRPQIADGGY